MASILVKVFIKGVSQCQTEVFGWRIDRYVASITKFARGVSCRFIGN